MTCCLVRAVAHVRGSTEAPSVDRESDDVLPGLGGRTRERDNTEQLQEILTQWQFVQREPHVKSPGIEPLLPS
jgi:hypothetical protein